MNWGAKKLGDVAPARPLKPKSLLPDEEVWHLNLDAIESNTGKVTQKVMAPISEAGSSTHWFSEEHVLYSKLRPYLNKVVLPNCRGLATTELVPLLPNPNVLDRGYLAHYLRSERFLSWVNQQVAGAKMPRVSMKVFWEHEIPLPFTNDPAKSLAEQKRIAAILDKANSIRDKRQQAIELADKFLHDTFLTMFGDPIINPNGWRTLYWKEAVRIINGKNQKKVESDTGPYPIYGSGGEMGRAEDYLCPENSVVIGRKGNINKPLLVKEKYWNVDTAFGLVPNIDLLSHNYLFWFCKLFNFEKLNRAVTIPSLTKADLQEIELPIPPPNIMKKFDEVVKAIDKFVHKLGSSQQKIEELVNSLSQKAFKGEL
ncbi:restriction endonuclease subunit S [Alteromonas sp. McT4-15]|uniref:restriction endonuclease subunit S n=1 Tax=Alteromonas sp. McT4-15 TaxID=2881256 RepID=UPI001CF922F6|nr:restriction endonuclease subunit S [Alteromonas sp. McT4-15]MCB4435556.1 restriction endonuclease subunit S [Alteromonas sp. McT4-15]